MFVREVAELVADHSVDYGVAETPIQQRVPQDHGRVEPRPVDSALGEVVKRCMSWTTTVVPFTCSR